MDTQSANRQGRARGLYDEQLQRQRQEKLLFRHPVPAAAEPVLPLADEAPRS